MRGDTPKVVAHSPMSHDRVLTAWRTVLAVHGARHRFVEAGQRFPNNAITIAGGMLLAAYPYLDDAPEAAEVRARVDLFVNECDAYLAEMCHAAAAAQQQHPSMGSISYPQAAEVLRILLASLFVHARRVADDAEATETENSLTVGYVRLLREAWGRAAVSDSAGEREALPIAFALVARKDHALPCILRAAPVLLYARGMAGYIPATPAETQFFRGARECLCTTPFPVLLDPHGVSVCVSLQQFGGSGQVAGAL